MTGPGAGSDAGGAALLLKNKKQNPQYMYMQLDKDM